MTNAPSQAAGAFTFVLHGHLPYVLTHGKWPHGSDMLFECAAESYLPLLQVFDRLVAEGISPKITLGLTPVLCEQLADPDFAGQFVDYLEAKSKVAQENRDEFRQQGEADFVDLAEMWRARFLAVRDSFRDEHGGDLIGQLPEAPG